MAVDNLELQRQINAALQERQKLLEKQTTEMRRQSEMARELKDTLGDIDVNTQVLDNMRKLRDSMDEALEVSEEQKDLNDEMFEALEEAFEESNEGWKDWSKNIKAAHSEVSNMTVFMGGFISGAFETFTGLKSIFSSFLGLAGSAVGVMLQLGKSLIALPISIFTGFVDMANKMGGGTQLAQAFEDIRKQFGDFRTGVSKDVITASRSMRGSLEGTGLSSYRVFGLLHERLNLVRELMTEMGPIAHQFSDEIATNAEVTLQFQKALGMTNEAMGAMALRANESFTTLADKQREVANQSLQMGKRFGIDQKLIGRDISEMMQDFENFGSVGTKQMASLSVFARKLGADFKELLGVVDQFDNFEDAAENAAKLAQSFGLNINAFEMMKEQDPGARIEALRKQFFLTGKSIEGMTRQEKALLAQTTGLKGAALEATFAAKNQGLTYEEIQKSSEDAEDAQLTQAEAMAKLAGSIERLVKSGSRQGGFWDRFLKGFRRGIVWSKDFWGALRNIRKSLWAAEKAGRAVGRAFVEFFPGVKEFIKGVREFFEPGKFQAMAKKVVSAFRQFFQDLKDSPEDALKKLFGNFKSMFGDMAGAQEGAIGKIIGGFKKFLKAMWQIAKSGLKMVSDQLVEWMYNFRESLREGKGFIEAFKSMFGKLGKEGQGFMSDVFNEIGAVIKDVVAPLMTEMWNVFKQVLSTIWGNIKEWWGTVDLWKDAIKPAFTAMANNPGVTAIIVGALFGPAFIKGAAAALGNSLLKIATGQGAGRITKAMGGLSKTICGAMDGKGCGESTGDSFTKSFGGKVLGAIKKPGFFQAPLGAGLGGSVKGLFAGGGPAVAARLGMVGLAGAVGYAVGTGLDKAAEWMGLEGGLSGALSRQISKWTGQESELRQKVNEQIAEQQKGMAQYAGTNAKIVEDTDLKKMLLSKEVDAHKDIQKYLKQNLELSDKDKEIALSALQIKMAARKAEISRQIVEKEGYEMGRGGHLKNKADQAELNMLIEERMGTEYQGLKEIEAQLKKVRDQRKGALLTEPKAAPSPPKLGIKDLDFLKKVEDIKPRQIKKTQRTFENIIKPALIGEDGTGGIKGTMTAIVDAFKNVDIGMFDHIAAAVKNAAIVPKALKAVQDMELDLSKIRKTYDFMKAGIVLLGDLLRQTALEPVADEHVEKAKKLLASSAFFIDGFTGLQKNLADFDPNKLNTDLDNFNIGIDEAFGHISNIPMPDVPESAIKKFEAIATQIGKIDSAISEVGSLADTLSGLSKSVSKYSRRRNVASMPVVKGITNMVSAVNEISKQLSSLSAVNATVKLKALGDAIGMGASGKFEVANKPVQLTVNLTVNMEAKDVAEELVKTKVVAVGPKSKQAKK